MPDPDHGAAEPTAGRPDDQTDDQTDDQAAGPTAGPTVGFIGLGSIGAPMAEHLLDAPGELVVCDVRPEATEPFAARGATVAGDAAAVARAGATVISVMVLDDAQVRDVVGALLPEAAPGTVIAIHSTIRPETAEELAAAAAPAGVAVIDAPVSGSVVGAMTGNLAVLAGGDRDAVDRCRETFAAFAGMVMYFGPAGAGTRAKLARNMITFVAYTSIFEAEQLAEASGVDLRKLAKVVKHSDGIIGGASTVMLRDTTGPLPVDDPLYGPLDHARKLGIKDLELALEVADQLGLDLPMTRLGLERIGPSLGFPDEERA
jgi:3-hydroxyisobutyrate dehydrogenase-like beta-hydroxyacid dehydrogenase